ncbi:hypothetical protein DFJ74DRAFT_738016 [Hyaloraphidium curvatum]|nr:hypothetical protein DFJ74DRAFT_738016 [Hyaloraphidium curvatum]
MRALQVALAAAALLVAASGTAAGQRVARGATSPWFSVDVALPRTDNATLVFLEDFGVSPAADDNTDAFMDGVRACDPGRPCYVTFRNRGTGGGPTYKFGGGTMYSALLVANLTDFVFDGADSRLLFTRPNWTSILSGWGDWTCSPDPLYEPERRTLIYRRALFAIDHVDRAFVGRFTMDWDFDRWPMSSLVEVVNATTTSWTVRFVDWPAAINGGRVDVGQLRGIRSIHLVDPATGTFGVKNGTEVYVPQPNAPRITYLDATTLRFDFDSPTSRVPEASPRQRWLLRHIAYDAHGFVVNRCNNCTFDSIEVGAVPGKLVVAGDGSQGLRFTNIRLAVPTLSTSTPGAAVFPRHITAASDGFFLSGTAGRILVQNVSLDSLGDDCANVHDVLATDTSDPAAPFPPPPLEYPATFHSSLPWSVDPRDARVLTLRGNFFAAFVAGDPVEFVDPATLTTIHSDRLAAVKADACGTMVLTFTSPIPPSFFSASTGRWLPSAPALQNRRYVASRVVLDRLSCSRNRARGVLLHTDDTILSNSRLERIAMACIFARADFLEREGRGLKRLGVYGNEFVGCDGNGWNAGAVDAHVWGKWDGAGRRVGVEDAEVSGNVFRNITRPAASIVSTSGFAFVRNAVVSDSLPVVTVASSTGPTVSDNVFAPSSGPPLAGSAVSVDASTTTDAVLGSNSFPASSDARPVPFPVPIAPAFRPSPPAVQPAPPSRRYSERLAGMPRCGTCSNGVPDLDDYRECVCRGGAGGGNLSGTGRAGTGWGAVVGLLVGLAVLWV